MEMREMPGYVCYYQRIKISQDRAAFVLDQLQRYTPRSNPVFADDYLSSI